MLEAIDRVGSFRGKILESKMNETQNGFPQFVVRLQASEFYDEDGSVSASLGLPAEPGWLDWSGYDQQIVGKLVLMNNDKQLLNFTQLSLALGWDGASFAELGVETAWLDKEVFFRVEENEYQGKIGLKVNWIDHIDASPTGGLRGLDAEKLKNLDVKFAALLNTRSKAAPVSAAPMAAALGKGLPSKPAAPTAAKPAAAPSSKTAASASAPAATASATGKAKPKLPSKAPVAKAPEPEVNEFEADVTATEASAEATKDSAWAFLASSKGEDVSDDILAEAWMTACESVAAENGFDSDEAFTPGHWAAVQNSVATKLNIAA